MHINNIYELIWVVLMAVTLGAVLVKHGEYRRTTYNFFATAIAAAVEFWLLYMAGLFH